MIVIVVRVIFSGSPIDDHAARCTHADTAHTLAWHTVVRTSRHDKRSGASSRMHGSWLVTVWLCAVDAVNRRQKRDEVRFRLCLHAGRLLQQSTGHRNTRVSIKHITRVLHDNGSACARSPQRSGAGRESPEYSTMCGGSLLQPGKCVMLPNGAGELP